MQAAATAATTAKNATEALAAGEQESLTDSMFGGIGTVAAVRQAPTEKMTTPVGPAVVQVASVKDPMVAVPVEEHAVGLE